jgi:hypothetical protein
MCDEEDRNFGATATGFLIMTTRPPHTSLKTTKFVTNNNMFIVSHPPYSPDLAPCDFALFPKLKVKLKGRFETMSDIQRESQAVLQRFKENDFHGALKRAKNDGIAVYVSKGTILKEKDLVRSTSDYEVSRMHFSPSHL